MVNRTSLTLINDDDYLSEGYHNGVYYATAGSAGVVYTGSGFDATQSSPGTDTHNTTLEVGAGTITTFVRIVLTLQLTAYGGGGGTGAREGTITLNIETSEHPAVSFTSRFNKTIAYAFHETSFNNVVTIEFYYAPASGEKTNGLDVKITGTCIGGSTAGTATLANIQTTIYTL